MSQKPEARSQEPEVRIQTPEARSQTPEVIHLHQNVANLEDSKNRMAGYFVKVAFMLLSLLGLLFLILSLATDYWSKVEGQQYWGLFQFCFVKNDICLKIRFDLLKGKVGREFKEVIVMMILAVSAQGCAVIVAIMSLIKKKNKTLVIFVASLKGAAVIFALVGLKSYMDLTNDFNVTRRAFHLPIIHLAWSYILGWLGLGFVTVSFFLVIAIYKIERRLAEDIVNVSTVFCLIL